VHVFDSFSTDRTVELASAAKAHVIQRVFDGFASQRNAALSSCPFKNKWVMILDADERVPTALYAEMYAFVCSAGDSVAAARIRRRDYFLGTWLKYSQISPFYIRLVRPDRVKYAREVNEVLEPTGAVFNLVEPFDHYPFNQGIAHWVNKHNQYSTMEARLVLATRRGEVAFSLSKALFERDFNVRRFHQKELFYRLPARPVVKFLLVYIAKRGFLDGQAGFIYAMLQAIYEYMIVLKTAELEKQSGETVVDSSGSQSGRHDSAPHDMAIRS